MARATVKGGIELEYEVHGEGAPLLLVMGLGAQMILWPDGFVRALVDRGFQVIRFDNRDTGLSSKGQGRAGDLQVLMMRRMLGLPIAAPYTLSDMAGDAIGLLDHLGVAKAHVVGASMGGMIAQTMAIEHGARLASLTSIMSSTGARRDLLSKPKALAVLTRPREATVEGAVLGTRAFFGACGGTTHAPDWDTLDDISRRSFERGFNPAGFVRQFAAILASGSRRALLPTVKVPTTVIHGAVDPLVLPHAGAATAKLIPGARFVKVDGMGHDMPRTTWPLLCDEIAALRDRAAA